ncbi:hypothetical protein BDW59DRAFT_179189 [Aspergillus cavernicola]|uniref:RED-like N-terminal domain-containing protein n=1 Tax=Aspergillus cavernicola TaxID=176166 RepID=A0ABR4IHC2_9EURO
MNNDQFRRLLFENNPASSPKGSNPTGSRQSQGSTPISPTENKDTHALSSGSAVSPGGGRTHGGALGSRMRSSIPMTPRTLTAPNFAHQLADYRRDAQNPPPNKKFKSSAAPKGTKLPTGYQDRAARLREISGESDETTEGSSSNNKEGGAEEKLKEMEERFKTGLIDEETFKGLRRELGFGGDLGSTHMIKGLDWDLLKRIRAGEDVSASTEEKGDEGEGEEKEGVDVIEDEEVVDVDEAFDKVLEGNEDEALPSAPKEKEKKKGSMAAPPVPAQRKTRDEILRELRASRAAAAAAEADATAHEPALGARFKRIGDTKVEKKRFIEQDENGRRREVLVITDPEGKTKRKTRWLDKPGTTRPSTALPALDKDAKPLGMEVPAEIAAKAKASQVIEEEDDDIFEGVGADYDPLGDGSDGDSSESEEDSEVATTASQKAPTRGPEGEPLKSRNYFATTTTEEEGVESDRANPLTKDPTLLAALKRAAALRQTSTEHAEEDAGVDKETLLRRKKFLEEAQRREALDAMDMDYGFGGSRNEDDEDDETVILERGGTKRKRGPRKKKGDKDSVSDVLGVLEGRKKA